MATTTGLSRRNYIVTGERGAIGSLIMDYFDNIFSINENMKKTDNGVLLHLAGSANTKRILDSNILYLKEIVEYCLHKNIRYFVYFSSVSVYGKQDRVDVDEDSPLVGIDLYGASKLFAEQYLKTIDKIKFLILRLPAVLTKKADTYIAKILNDLKQDIDIILTNYDKQFNNFISVEDIARFIKQYNFDKHIEIVNFASNQEQTLYEVVLYLKELVKSKSNIICRDTQSRYYNICIDKLKNRYNFTPLSYKKSLKNWVEITDEA